MFRFVKSLLLIKRSGIRGILNVVSFFKRRPPATLKSETFITESERQVQGNMSFQKQVKISLISPLNSTPDEHLKETLDSIIAQTYINWELCIVGNDNRKTSGNFSALIQNDSRIKYRELSGQPDISEIINNCIQMSTGNYIGIVEMGDILHPSALFEVIKAICYEDADFIYTDEAVFSNNHNIILKHHKPGFAVDTLRSHNYINHLAVFNKNMTEKAGAFRNYYDTILRLTDSSSKICHVPMLLYFSRNKTGSGSCSAGVEAIKDHLKNRNIPAQVESKTGLPGFYRVNYEITEKPLVSIIIPNKDYIYLLRNCIKSIKEKTTYENYEIIIVENNSRKKSTFRYYEELKGNPKIKIVHWEGNGFNYSKLCNFGAEKAGGQQLIFLNNDIEIISPSWIEEMLMYSQRNDVGAVGIKLYYLNGSVQHAGLVLGMKETAGHIYLSESRDAPGYMAKLQIAQNMSAVTAACIMIKKKVFEEAGFFDPDFCASFNDVDLCLKIRNAGYLVVWTPYAEAYHLESKSRGYNVTRAKRRLLAHEAELFKTKWKKELSAGDPYYNRNFSLEKADYSLK